MSMFGIEVAVEIAVEPGRRLFEWRRMRPVSGKPYKFDTRAKAEDMGRLCYPEPQHRERWRVVELFE